MVERGRLSIAALASALVGLVLLGGILLWPLRICHDSAWCLQAAQLLLQGQRPYIDFVELDPPMVIYLNVIPALLARVSPLHAATTFNLLVWCFVVVSITATRRIVSRIPSDDSVAVADALALSMAVASVFVLSLFQHGQVEIQWGQREHVFMCVAIPYLAMRLARTAGVEFSRSSAVALGFITGLAACMKPHFVVILLAGEAWLILIHSRKVWALIKPETFALAIVGALYAIHFALLPADIRSAFFGRQIPLLMAHYGAYGMSFGEMARMPRTWFGVVALLLAFAPIFRSELPMQLARVVGVAGFTGTLMLVQQGKGWPYHAIPGEMALCCVAGLVVRELLARWTTESRAVSHLMHAAVAIGVVVCIVLLGRARFGSEAARTAGETPVAQTIKQFTHPGDTVLVLDTSLTPAYPALLQAERFPGSRFPFLFELAMLFDGKQAIGGTFPYQAGSGHPVEERRVRDELASDIATRKPALVAIIGGRTCQGCPEGFDLLEYFKATGFIDRNLSGYRSAGQLRSGRHKDGFFELYVANR